VEHAGVAAPAAYRAAAATRFSRRRHVVTATIGREELKAKIDSGGDVVLVETLDPEYYEDAHLPGAVNLPLDRIGQLAPEILLDKDAEIVVYCMSSL
jgi:rhodanese-related sulfurtransferase